MDKGDNKQRGLLKNKQIREFLEMLVEKKGYKNISAEIKEQIVKDLAERLDTFIVARVITSLSDEDIIVFEKMLRERKPDAEIQEFIKTHIDDFDAFLTAVLLEFKDVYLAKIPKPVVIEDKDIDSEKSSSFIPPAPIDTRN